MTKTPAPMKPSDEEVKQSESRKLAAFRTMLDALEPLTKDERYSTLNAVRVFYGISISSDY